MNNTALRYKTYKALLEVDLTTAQRQRLIEAGIIDKVLDFFGAGKDALTKYGGGLKKMFSDSKYARRSATAKKNIEKELNDLKSVAKDAGEDESVVYQILNMILTDAGVDPKVVGNPPTADGSGGEQPAASTGLPSGTPIKLDSKNATTTFAKINADATGEDPKKAADDAVSQKMSPEKMSVQLMKSIAKATGVKFSAVDAVAKALIDTNHLVAEGRLPLTRSSLLRMYKEVQALEERRLVTERWQHLAGFEVRTSGYLFEDAVQQLITHVNDKKNDIKSVTDLASLVKSKYDALGDAEKQKVITKLAGDNALNDKLGKKSNALKQELTSALSSAGGSSEGKDDAVKKDEGGKDAAAAAKKKYAAAFDDVKKSVANKVDDDSIGKVLTYLDDLETVEIK